VWPRPKPFVTQDDDSCVGYGGWRFEGPAIGRRTLAIPHVSEPDRILDTVWEANLIGEASVAMHGRHSQIRGLGKSYECRLALISSILLFTVSNTLSQKRTASASWMARLAERR
jgi:hypothetical protein